MQSQKQQNDLCSLSRQAIQYHNNPSLQVYAPTTNARKAEVELFYEDLQDLLVITPKKGVLIIIGDWNAKVGNRESPGVTGKSCLGVQNEAGQRLTRVLSRRHTGHSKHPLQQQKRRLCTWTSPDGQHLYQIDYILCSQRWRISVQSEKTRWGADCGSDHELFLTQGFNPHLLCLLYW